MLHAVERKRETERQRTNRGGVRKLNRADGMRARECVSSVRVRLLACLLVSDGLGTGFKTPQRKRCTPLFLPSSLSQDVFKIFTNIYKLPFSILTHFFKLASYSR